ncbi:MAG: Ig-like domain-containing protein, partial [Deltaproteobacteria bacterium]|nr:Ig-like domain-containing protein [Deltaproteobacteria bacterium]
LFRFWDDLSSAEDFPTDGNAHWVHPATALRLMSTVSVKQDHDDPSIGTDASDPDHLHPGQDITIIVADAKGPLAGVNVTVRADGNQIAQAMTDSSGEILVRLEDAAGKTIEVEVAKDAMDGGQLYNTVNETGSPQGLMPGSSVGQQTTNGTDVVPAPRLGLRVKTTGNIPTQADWDDELHKPKGAKGPDIGKDEFIDIERFVFRREDGKFEGAEASYKGQICYFWTIYDGAGAITPAPRDEHGGDSKDPLIVGSWSDRIAHLTDHPVFSGRALNIADGTELEVTWVVMLAQAAPEHDKVLCTDKVKTAAGGFSVAFDPHTLTQDQGFLNTPKPVYPKIKSGDKEFALRGQSVTCYADNKVEDPGPAPVPVKADGPEIVAYTSIDRNGTIDKLTLWDKSAPATKSVHEFAPELAANFICDGNDKIYVGATALELHLATTAEVHMSPADALEHQKQRTKAIYPDAPDSLWAQGEQLSWHANNGISVGICAFHCKDGVTPGGLKNGCNESIRQNNIGSCHNASYSPCKTAVQLGTPSNKVKSCGGALGACGTAGHDKSHCFMAEPVTGDNAEERERWYVALPMRISGNGYPYKHSGRDKQLNVLLINPKNGKMVVCSQEDRGPSATCTSNAAYPTANVKADEFKGKGRIVGPSYETAWKLDLPKLGYDPVVMVAFVANSVPLGPVAPGTKIRLKEKATLVELLGAYAAT